MPPPPAIPGPRLSAMMFLQFFIWGGWYVTVGNFMAARGLGDAIYWAYTVGPIAAIVSPFFLGMVADRFFPTQRILGILHLLGALAMLAAPMAAEQGPTPFILVLLLHMLCYMPTLGLSNAIAFRHLASQEKGFPLVRVFGTIGWIAANLVVSAGLHADTGPAQFWVTSAAGLALGLYSFSLPHTPPPAAGRPASIRDILGLDALAMLRDRSFAVFLVSSFLLCIPLAAYYAYAPVYVKASGFENAGATMSLGQMSEIVFMLAMPAFFAFLGVRWMLLLGMLAWVIRYALFAAAAPGGPQWMILAGIILHGICYDFFFVTGFIYTDRRAGPRVRAQAQGLLVLVTQGLGLGVGAQVMGLVEKSARAADGAMDWRTFWLFPLVGAAIVAVAFFALFRERGSTPSEVRPERSG
ncbi:MAG: MFS transporter [Phycisphaerales bacterium]